MADQKQVIKLSAREANAANIMKVEIERLLAATPRRPVRFWASQIIELVPNSLDATANVFRYLREFFSKEYENNISFSNVRWTFRTRRKA